MVKRGVQTPEWPDTLRRAILDCLKARPLAAAEHHRVDLRSERVDGVLDHRSAIDQR
jgi:hypothetical protein